ncbi:MAG: hypothetical protein WCV84_04745 [Patescibacteria group bacterium]
MRSPLVPVLFTLLLSALWPSLANAQTSPTEHVETPPGGTQSAPHPLPGNELSVFTDFTFQGSGVVLGGRLGWFGLVLDAYHRNPNYEHPLHGFGPDFGGYLTIGGPLAHPGYTMLLHLGAGYSFEERAPSLRQQFLLVSDQFTAGYASAALSETFASWSHEGRASTALELRGGLSINLGPFAVAIYGRLWSNLAEGFSHSAFGPGVLIFRMFHSS